MFFRCDSCGYELTDSLLRVFQPLSNSATKRVDHLNGECFNSSRKKSICGRPRIGTTMMSQPMQGHDYDFSTPSSTSFETDIEQRKYGSDSVAPVLQPLHSNIIAQLPPCLDDVDKGIISTGQNHYGATTGSTELSNATLPYSTSSTKSLIQNPYRSKSNCRISLDAVSTSATQQQPRQPQHYPPYRPGGNNTLQSPYHISLPNGCKRSKSMPQSKTALQLLHEGRKSCAEDPMFLLQPPELQKQSPIQPLPSNREHRGTLHTSIAHSDNCDWLRLPLGGLHELVGEAGAGKTQVALSMCVQAASVEDDNNGSIRSIYISLKGTSFLSRVAHRLNQMVSSSRNNDPTFLTKNDSGNDISEIDVNKSEQTRILNRILTRGCLNTDDLFEILQNDIPNLLRERQRLNNNSGIRLLVLDSVADLFRGQLDGATTTASANKGTSNVSMIRSSMLFRLSMILKQLSDNFYPLCIVVVNQVTAAGFGCSSSHGIQSDQSVLPALGLSWEHCVNSSFMLSRKEGNTRKVTLRKSSHHRIGQTAAFVIGSDGCFISNQINERN